MQKSKPPAGETEKETVIQMEKRGKKGLILLAIGALCQRLLRLQNRSGKLYLTFLREGAVHIVRDTGRGLHAAQ